MSHIETATDFSFVYNENIALSQKKNIAIKDKSLTFTLSVVFRNTGIRWKINGKHIVLQKETKKVSVSGYISDKSSSETLIGANIGETGSNSGTVSNNYGYFTLSLPEGKTELQVSYIGYQTEKIPLFLRKDTVLNIRMEQSVRLKEVVIEVGKNKPFTPSSGVIELTRMDILNTPTLMGEPDVIKTLQLLPGVQAGVEGTAGLYVRGGGPDQNLTLLDGVNVYNINHFYGLFSIFNGDAVKKVTLYKSSFPARFGGRLSSVIDTRLKDGDMHNYHGDISIGLVTSHFNLEGPIVKDKTSFSISARRSYVDALLQGIKLLTNEEEYDSFVPSAYFYDLNAKINHKFSDKSRLYFSFYSGKDKMGVLNNRKNEDALKKNIDYHWGNTIASMRWNYVLSQNLFANVTMAYNNYQFDFNTADITEMKSDKGYSHSEYRNYQHSGINDLIANFDMEFLPNERHDVRFGGGYIFHTFKPEVYGNTLFEFFEGDTLRDIRNNYLSENTTGHETSLYAEDEIALSAQWKANLGVHFSTFHVGKKNYWSLQPRISLGYEITPKLSLKTSYSEMSQYIHLLASSTLSQPTDLWVPVTPELPPMFSRQVTLGAYYDTQNNYNFSVEGFYKNMDNLLEYKEGSSWISPSVPWYEQVESGKGRVYGVELFAQKTQGNLTGWLGYTWSWNDRKFPTINEGKRFPSKYDRRHDLKINATYKISKKFDFSAAWVFSSGNTYSLSMEEYSVLSREESNPVYYEDYKPSEWIERYESRNNYRIPPTHHLDLSMNYYRKKNTKGRQSIWNITIFNVYNQACPFLIFPDFSEKKGKHVIKQVNLLPILPSFSYTYKF
jgi:outer membrane receptor for ferrienterochelin and colicin